MIGTSMYFWLFNLPELERHKDVIIDNIVQRTKMIGADFLQDDAIVNNRQLNVLKWIQSKFYYVGDLD
jgi:hypothetical protein